MSIPLPESVTDCGLSGALSVMVIAPARPFVIVGVKVTEMAQVALGATCALVHVSLAFAKSPLTLTLLTVSCALPVLVMVTDDVAGLPVSR